MINVNRNPNRVLKQKPKSVAKKMFAELIKQIDNGDTVDEEHEDIL